MKVQTFSLGNKMWLFIKPGPRDQGREYEESSKRGDDSLGFRKSFRGFREMFTKIPGNVLEDSGENMKRLRESWRKSRRIFEKIPGNI